MSKHRKRIPTTSDSSSSVEKRRKLAEAGATFGLILVAAALAVPFANLLEPSMLVWSKWIYAAGALIYTVARIVGISDPSESFRLRRLRRLEAWAGIALCVAAFFWFYNESRFGARFGFTLAVLRETIIFTLVGAMIQIIASWLIYYREKKEKSGSDTKN